jgi:hypothetical protein
MTKPEDFDPFAGGQKVPSISFKDQPVGTVRSLLVSEYATTAQSTDFETGELAYWPARGNEAPKSKLSAVLKGTDPETGEPLSLWAQIPSAMLKAVSDAQEAIAKGYRIKPGDRLDIQHYGDKPNEKNPRLNAQKLYRAKITVGVEPAPAADDPWTSTPASSSPAVTDSGFGDEPPF